MIFLEFDNDKVVKMKGRLRKVPKSLSDIRSFRKGQAAIEFLALLIVVMLASTAVYAGFFSRLSYADSSESILGMQEACRSIANAVKRAETFGGGFSMNITAPEGNYSLSVLNNTVVCSDGNSAFMEAVFGNATNSTGGAFFAIQKKIKVENTLGRIVVS